MDTINVGGENSVAKELKLLNDDIKKNNAEEKQKEGTGIEIKTLDIDPMSKTDLPNNPYSQTLGIRFGPKETIPNKNKEVAIFKEKTNLNIKVPFFKKMELTIKALSEREFTVKQDGNKWVVCLKRAIIVPGVFDESLAKNIAEEYNKVTRKYKEKFQMSMEEAKEQVEGVYNYVCSSISGNVVPKVCESEECEGFCSKEESHCGRYDNLSDCIILREGKD